MRKIVLVFLVCVLFVSCIKIPKSKWEIEKQDGSTEQVTAERMRTFMGSDGLYFYINHEAVAIYKEYRSVRLVGRSEQ